VLVPDTVVVIAVGFTVSDIIVGTVPVTVVLAVVWKEFVVVLVDVVLVVTGGVVDVVIVLVGVFVVCVVVVAGFVVVL